MRKSKKSVSKKSAKQTRSTRKVDEDAFQPDGLTIRQRRFVDALVGPAGGNATRAAELAGYAAENRNSLTAAASRLLTFVNVSEAIAHAYAKLRDTAEWARNSLVDIASSSMARFVTVNQNGEAAIDFSKAAEAGALGQIKEYTEDSIGEVTIRRKIKIHDRLAAVTTLLKLHEKLTDRVAVTGPDGGPVKVKHSIDHARFAELYQTRTAGQQRGNGAGAGAPEADGN